MAAGETLCYAWQCPPRCTALPHTSPTHRLSNMEIASLKDYREQVTSGRVRAGSILKWRKEPEEISRSAVTNLVDELSDRLAEVTPNILDTPCCPITHCGSAMF